MSAAAGPILVFGAGGQVGHELVAIASPLRTVVGLTHAQADICNADAVEAAVRTYRPSAIVNAAAYTAVDRAELDVTGAFAVNELGAANLARTAARQGVDLIHISTDYVFDGSKRKPYVESDPVQPLGAYGRSKEAGERAVRAECERHVILRTAWVYGAHGANFVKTMVRLAAERDVVRVVADQQGAPTAAGDLANGIHQILSRFGEGSRCYGTFHLTNSGHTTWHGFAARIFAILSANGRRVPHLEAIATADYPTPAVRPKYSVLDCSQVSEVFGVTLRSWESAIEDVMVSLQSSSATGKRGAA